MKIMKKFILSLGLVAMMLNLTNCAQYEDVNPTVNPQGDFALYASISRTANDGLNTVWEAEDQINVFHAVGETTTYVNDGQFTLASAETGRFLGKLNGTLDVAEKYDWYAFYPYGSYMTTPANNSGSRTYIGSHSDEAQTQTGNNSMNHIAGTNYPMAGYAESVAADEQPSLVFTHISSLVEFEVTNGLSEAITVLEIQFTAEEDIIGYYYINIADSNNHTFTKYNTYQSNTAILTVNGGEAIEPGKSAKFYLAVKPFTAAAGSELKVSVSAKSATGNGSHTKSISLTKESTFVAGKIKNVKVNYTTVIEKPAAGEEVVTLSFASKATNRTSYSTTQQVWEQDGIVFTNDKSASTTDVADYEKPVRCYKSSSIEVTAPGKISKIVFDANSNDYATALETSIGTISGATVSVSSDKVTIEYSTPVDNVSIAQLSAQIRLDALTVTYIMTPAIVASNFDVPVVGGEGEATYEIQLFTNDDVEASTAAEWLTVDAGDGIITWEAKPNYTGAVRKADVVLTSAGADVEKTITVSQAADVFTVSPTEISLGADAEATAKFTVNSTYEFTLTNPDADKLSLSHTSGEGTVEITVTARTENTLAEVLTLGDIVVTRAGDNATKEVAVEQKAASTGGEPAGGTHFVKVTSAPSDWSGTYLIVYETGNLAFDGSLTTLDAGKNFKSITINNKQVEATDAMKAIAFTIEKNGTSYTIKSASSYYIGQTSKANGLKSSTTTKYDHTISFVNENDITISISETTLRYNANSGDTNQRFRYYKSGQQAIQLYKLN